MQCKIHISTWDSLHSLCSSVCPTVCRKLQAEPQYTCLASLREVCSTVTEVMYAAGRARREAERETECRGGRGAGVYRMMCLHNNNNNNNDDDNNNNNKSKTK